MLERLTPLLLCLLVHVAARAQFVDDFEDGDLATNPVWTGDLDHWIVEDSPTGRRLATRGLSESDTLVLHTPAQGPFGTWSIRYGHTGGALSNFNQVRIFVWAADEGGAAYYVLIGSNDRTIKLYERNDTGTVDLLAAAAADLLDADNVDVRIRIEHDYVGAWRAWLDGTPVIDVPNARGSAADGGVFRLWVKHTASRGSDHWFDDVSASGRIASDTTGPRMSAATPADRRSLTVRFTEPVTSDSACRPGSYALVNTGSGPPSVRCPASPITDTLRLEYPVPLALGPNRLTAYGITDPSGNITALDTISFVVLEAGLPPSRTDLVINEIDYAPSPAESEFVEVLNRSQKRIDLSTIWIADDRTRAPISTQPRLLEPRSYVVVTRSHAALSSRFPAIDAIEVDGWPSLNNSGDRVSILHLSDTLDTVAYASSTGGDVSLERVDPASPSDLGQNWQPSRAAGGATPGEVNSVYAPDTTAPDLVFVEQTSPVALRAVFSEAIPTGGIRADLFDLDGARPTVVAPGEPRYSSDFFLAFHAVDAGTLNAHDVVDAAGNTAGHLASDVNLLPLPGTLVINEIMFEPRIDDHDGLPDQTEYVELRNLSRNPVTLNACALEGPENERREIDTMPLRASSQGLPGYGYVVVVDAKISAVSGAFFRGVPEPNVRPLATGSLSLRNQGSSVTLSCAGDQTDAAAFNPGWHHPALLVTRGVSLERISAVAPSADPRTWTSSTDPTGGTPGRVNSVATPDWAPESPIEIAPSPFSSDGQGDRNSTTIRYRLRSDRAFVRITVFNSRGRAVRHLTRGRISPCVSAIVWDGRDDAGHSVPTGIYVVFLEATDPTRGTVEHHRAPVVAVRGFK